MTKTPRLLFIGSTVADVIVRVPRIPVTGGDEHVTSQRIALGGCAFNAFSAARLLGEEPLLFSPVGSGLYGDWVRSALAERGIVSPIPPVEAPNGCCYCLVEDDGERTFLSQHGAEYRFQAEWFDLLGSESFDGVYLCGLEVEESTGPVILDYLTGHPPVTLYFAPGPRINRIRPERMAQIFALHPTLHLNMAEALTFTRTGDPEAAAQTIRQVTGGDVVITLGENGALVLDENGCTLTPGCPVRPVDTIGAGDAHIGAVMAGRAAGLTLAEAVEHANSLSACVVSHEGAIVTAEEWKQWKQMHHA